jgi:nitroimidazol reductase NimA-like FMN-containing flavoprotein (pyridoxamine 5'-phosphate oxidase superfamily)
VHSRIAFEGESRPYIALYFYVFDGKFIYFLSTKKYGRKIEQFRRNPLVTVEVEKYSPDLSNFSFVTIPGRLFMASLVKNAGMSLPTRS